MERDPLEYVDSMNALSYTTNSPTSYRDPSGRQAAGPDDDLIVHTSDDPIKLRGNYVIPSGSTADALRSLNDHLRSVNGCSDLTLSCHGSSTAGAGFGQKGGSNYSLGSADVRNISRYRKGEFEEGSPQWEYYRQLDAELSTLFQQIDRLSLYGCGIATTDRGKDFVDELSELYGKPVRAPTNPYVGIDPIDGHFTPLPSGSDWPALAAVVANWLIAMHNADPTKPQLPSLETIGIDWYASGSRSCDCPPESQGDADE